MRTMSRLLRSRAVKLAGSLALGLGLLTLGLTALAMLALALPADAGKETWDNDWNQHDSKRTEGQPFHWSGKIPAGKTLEVHGINGSIEAVLATGSEATVDARKSAHKSDPEGVKIEVVQSVDGVLICARYPRPDGTLNDCDGKHEETRNNDVVVKFRVAVPAGVNLVARTVNGGLSITGLKGDVDASTVNGGVRVSTSGTASATTVNGSVTARIGSDLKDDVEFTTVNGGVRVEMPRSVNANVYGRTVSGSISSDFPLNVRGRYFGKRIEGRLGKGGYELTLSSVNGPIELRTLDGSRSKSKASDDDDDEDIGDTD